MSAAPHIPCATTLWNMSLLAKLLVHMGGIDVSRHDREYLDILVGERPNEARGISEPYFVECLVLDARHGASPP